MRSRWCCTHNERAGRVDWRGCLRVLILMLLGIVLSSAQQLCIPLRRIDEGDADDGSGGAVNTSAVFAGNFSVDISVDLIASRAEESELKNATLRCSFTFGGPSGPFDVELLAVATPASIELSLNKSHIPRLRFSISIEGAPSWEFTVQDLLASLQLRELCLAFGGAGSEGARFGTRRVAATADVALWGRTPWMPVALPTSMSFAACTSSCGAAGGVIATPRTKREDDIMFSVFEASGQTGMWIGMRIEQVSPSVVICAIFDPTFFTAGCIAGNPSAVRRGFACEQEFCNFVGTEDELGHAIRYSQSGQWRSQPGSATCGCMCDYDRFPNGTVKPPELRYLNVTSFGLVGENAAFPTTSRTRSASPTFAPTRSETHSGSPSPTLTLSRPMTRTASHSQLQRSWTASRTPSALATRSRSASRSFSRTEPPSRSATRTASPTLSPTVSRSGGSTSPSISATLSRSRRTPSITVSRPPTSTSTRSPSSSASASLSLPPTVTPTSPPTATPTASASRARTRSSSPTHSLTRSMTATLPPTPTRSPSHSPTPTMSASTPPTPTHSFTVTPMPSATETPTRSASSSSAKTASATLTRSANGSRSLSHSRTRLGLSATRSLPTPTWTVSPSSEVTAMAMTPTSSRPPSHSVTHSAARTATASHTVLHWLALAALQPPAISAELLLPASEEAVGGGVAVVVRTAGTDSVDNDTLSSGDRASRCFSFAVDADSLLRLPQLTVYVATQVLIDRTESGDLTLMFLQSSIFQNHTAPRAPINITLSVLPRCLVHRGETTAAHLAIVAFDAASAAPQTAAPRKIPEKLQDASESVATIVTVAGGIVGSPVTAVHASRSSMALSLQVCAPAAEGLPRSVSPTGFQLGNSEVGFYLGALVMNTALLLGVALLQLLGAKIYQCRRRCSFDVARRKLRFPSLLAFVIMFFLEPTIMCAVVVATRGSTAALQAAGSLGLVACASIPLLVYHQLFANGRFGGRFIEDWGAHVDQASDPLSAPLLLTPESGKEELAPVERAVADDQPPRLQRRNVVERIFFGSSKWIDQESAPGFCQRTRLFFCDYNGTHHYFLLCEMAVCLAIGVVDGVSVGVGHCNVLLLIIIVILALYLAAVVFLRPYNAPFLTAFVVGITVLQLTALLLVAAAAFADVEEADDYAEIVSLVCLYIVVGRTITDLCPKLYRGVKGALRAAERHRKSPHDVLSDGACGVVTASRSGSAADEEQLALYLPADSLTTTAASVISRRSKVEHQGKGSRPRDDSVEMAALRSDTEEVHHRIDLDAVDARLRRLFSEDELHRLLERAADGEGDAINDEDRDVLLAMLEAMSERDVLRTLIDRLCATKGPGFRSALHEAYEGGGDLGGPQLMSTLQHTRGLEAVVLRQKVLQRERAAEEERARQAAAEEKARARCTKGGALLDQGLLDFLDTLDATDAGAPQRVAPDAALVGALSCGALRNPPVALGAGQAAAVEATAALSPDLDTALDELLLDGAAAGGREVGVASPSTSTSSWGSSENESGSTQRTSPSGSSCDEDEDGNVNVDVGLSHEQRRQRRRRTAGETRVHIARPLQNIDMTDLEDLLQGFDANPGPAGAHGDDLLVRNDAEAPESSSDEDSLLAELEDAMAI